MRWLRTGKIAGVQLVLNNWFLALILLFSLVGLGGKAAGVFLAVIWHEAAHAVVALILGFKVREIELLPFGGVARIDSIGEADSISEIMIAGAGPLASLVMAAALYLLRTELEFMAGTLEFYYQANIMLAAFNLLPSLPLDGGRIVRAWLAMRWDYGKATRLVGRLGKLISVILVMMVAIDYWRAATINLTFIVAAIFLYIAAKAELGVVGFRLMRIMAHKKTKLLERGMMTTVHIAVINGVTVRDVVRVFRPEAYYVVMVLDKEFKVQGIISETEIWEALPDLGLHAVINEFL
ncbi:MAG: peptidase [Firmicutes bacterium]|nr:peptidase [Bacillota bacterium]